MLSCRDISRHADRYIDRELPWPIALQIRMHTWMCKHCRRYLAQLKLTSRCVRHLLRQARLKPDEEAQIVKLLLDARSERHT